MKVVTIDPSIDRLWQQLVTRERSDVFHAPEWFRVLKDIYGFEL